MEMTLNQYAAKANAFATYNKELGPYYTILGLCGEAGEVANRLKKVYRDNDGALDKDATKELAFELGDVLWYLSQSASQLGLTLEQIAELNIAKLYKRQHPDEQVVPPSTNIMNDNDITKFLSYYETKVLKDLKTCWDENTFEPIHSKTHKKFVKCVEDSLKKYGIAHYQHEIVCDETNNTPDVVMKQKIKLDLNFKHSQGYYCRVYTLPDDFDKIQK